MAILEKIRKRTSVLIVIIGLALFSFVISSLIKGGGQSSENQDIGIINGENIESGTFNRRVENYSRRIGGNLMYALNTIWNEQIRISLMSEAVAHMGIQINRSLLPEVIQKNSDFKQIFANFQDKSGDFNFSQYQSYLLSIKESNPSLFDQFLDQERYVLDQEAFGVYESLVKVGLTTSPPTEGEYKYHLETDKATLSGIKIPYSSVADSLVNVTDTEIKTYVTAHPKQYEQEPEISLRYVFFEEKASLKDEQDIQNELKNLLSSSEEYNVATDKNDVILGFAETEDVAAFLEKHSDTSYSDKYLVESQISTNAKALVSLPTDSIFGPYKDNDAYKLTRKIGMTKIMDSVKSSHIIVPFRGANRAEKDTKFSKVEAKKYIDSIYQLVKNDDKKFAEIAKIVNTDGSKNAGGDIGWTRYSSISDKTFDENFSDYIFFHKKGSIGVVESKFGYHIIRIDEQKSLKKAYKFAAIQRRIDPSDHTINAIFTKATNFELEVSKKKVDFDETAQKDSVSAKNAKNLKILADGISGLKNSRSIVKWAFQEDTDVGAVKRFNTSEGYVVAKLTAKKPKGIKNVDDARSVVKPILVKEKKAEIIKEKYATKTFDELSAEAQFKTFDATVKLNSSNIDNIGRESKLVGTAFAMENGTTSKFIAGENGVYLIKLTSKEDAPTKENYDSYLNDGNKTSIPQKVIQALKDLADIEDNRSVFY